MKYEDAKKDWYTIYTESCDKCGQSHKLMTQEDRCPEYYTEFIVECKCGEAVFFRLPVN